MVRLLNRAELLLRGEPDHRASLSSEYHCLSFIFSRASLAMRVADRPGERAEPRARAYKMLVIAGLLVSALLLFAAAAWQDRRGLLREAGEEALRTTAIFQQHALNVLKVHELVAARIDERLQGLSWDEIGRSEGVHR